MISFCNAQGKARDFRATDLARLLADYRSLRLVVLNACEGARGSGQDVFSSTASILVQRKLPAVLAMQYAITDRAAIEMARSFYEALADGLPVDTAVSEARKGISFAVTNTVEWGTPVLFMRAPDGQLFEMTAPPEPAPRPPAVEQPPKPRLELKSSEPEAQKYLVILVKKIGDTFSVEELRSLCFDMGVEYEDFPRTKSSFIRELVTYFDHRQRVGDLIAELEKRRPNTNWPQLPASPTNGTTRQTDYKTKYGEPDWVEIPAGKFWMGSESKAAYGDEKPVHQVYLDTYLIGRTPVTNAQYQLFVAATGHEAPEHWKDGSVPKGLADHSVVYVSWQDALAYCRWLSEVVGKEIMLPSEAEWEKAARGDKDKRAYPWGDIFYPQRANTRGGGPGQTTAVGSYPQGASPYGILDMSGNVWEWTRSLLKAYPYLPDDGRENLEEDDARGVRGGAFLVNQRYSLGGAIRKYYNPHLRFNDMGFRVVEHLSGAGF